MLDRLNILIYHRVGEDVDPLFPGEVTAPQFSGQMSLLARYFNPLPLAEAMQRMSAGRLPSRAVCVTFDDGYADNAEIALPILEKHGVPATFFVATSFLDGGRMWNDTIIESVRNTRLPSADVPSIGTLALDGQAAKRGAIEALLAHAKYLAMEDRVRFAEELATLLDAHPANDLMLSQEQLERLHSSGMEIGAHTVHHPILATLDDVQAREEIAASVNDLEQRLGIRVESFAYPNGKPDRDYTARDVELVKAAGIKRAVCTAPGFASLRSDPFQLPRSTPWDRSSAAFGMRLMQNYFRGQESYAKLASAACLESQHSRATRTQTNSPR